MKKTYEKVLCIAGSDSGGCAGIQADLKTTSALHCFGMTVLTALTAQNTKGVQAVYPIDPEFVLTQLNSIQDDMGIDSVKIGMLFDAHTITKVADFALQHRLRNLVLDPVMISTSGDHLLKPEAVNALINNLLPLATIVTPNIAEAEILVGMKISTYEDCKIAARKIAQLGVDNVLVKGGHMEDSICTDFLYCKQEDYFYSYSRKRILTNNTHGTGCTLSTAIACYLAKGFSIKQSIELAVNYLSAAIKHGAQYHLGTGNGPVLHAWQTMEKIKT